MMITVVQDFLGSCTLVAVPVKLSLMISQITWFKMQFYFVISPFEHNLWFQKQDILWTNQQLYQWA
jgi:hypothetical protein